MAPFTVSEILSILPLPPPPVLVWLLGDDLFQTPVGISLFFVLLKCTSNC